MLLKTAAATLTAAASMVALIGIAAPAAEAGYRTGNRHVMTGARVCHFTNDQGDDWRAQDSIGCNVYRTENINGQTVWHIRTADAHVGVLLMDDGSASFWFDGIRYEATWGNYNGYTEVYQVGGTYNFRF